MKFHFITSILFALNLTFLALVENLYKRMLLLIPAFFLFYITFFLFIIEYDKQNTISWKKKEEELIQKFSRKNLKKQNKKESKYT